MPGPETLLTKFNVPSISVNAEKISSAMAARLSTSLLCHVLFLKGQIPFPVVQLSRMPGAQSNPKAGKKREELMNAVDTLSSHLQTTFTALSTAYALRKERLGGLGDVEDAPHPGMAYMTFVLGPSVGSAKARVMLALSGLEVKVWGTRNDVDVAQGSISDVGESDSGSDHSESSSSDDEEVNEREVSDAEHESASLPPPSRSPSPVSRPASPLTSVLNTPPNKAPFCIATSPSNDKSPPKLAKPAFKIFSENSPTSAPPKRRPLSVLGLSTQKASPKPLSPSNRAQGENMPPRLRPMESISALLARLSLSQKPGPKAVQPPTQSYDEEQQALRVADRLLSRTLANACAEEDGGMSDELAPTQTQVLLRAPRCFSHPAWVPRQNLTRTLDGQLQAFLHDSIQIASSESAPQPKKKAQRTGVKTEGVWVTSANGYPDRPPTIANVEGVHEDDEMIWWVWDGKIVGFSDW